MQTQLMHSLRQVCQKLVKCNREIADTYTGGVIDCIGYCGSSARDAQFTDAL
ncbi:hypothetical protein Q667_07945 [Marinobacter sp. C1S70]|uniref:hypothetical protein n=1 Tax=Marinobacter sp. C1S70 TaxID=1396859 RepID=UPI0003B82C56|nr:hypothetical protein [Marinobacter sp. C1S70]ERS90722.1 hypothetical protein Q667_07945 [Marinobacter sp. C1S70]